MQTLSTCHFIEHGDSVLVPGPPGLGSACTGRSFVARITTERSQGNAGPPQVSLTPAGGGLGAARPWGRSEGVKISSRAARGRAEQRTCTESYSEQRRREIGTRSRFFHNL
jgi:hypothetical protein